MLSNSWKLIIIHVYMGQDMVSLFPLSAKICVVDVYCKCYALVYIANVIHRSGALDAYNEELSEPGVHPEL